MWAEFHFLRPWWLLALVPLAIWLAGFVRQRFAARQWNHVVDRALLPHVLIGTGRRSRRRVTVLLAICGVLLITALAGPVWQRVPRPMLRNMDALVIALDLSRSMDIADIRPTRLERARFKIRDILDKRPDGQTALLAYAADAFVISPLTDDTRTIATQLPALATDLMPSQGSRADRALEKASALLHQAGVPAGQVLLITDGVHRDRVEPVARKLAAAGIRVSVLGVGTADGGPVPGPNGFAKRPDGSIVIDKLDEDSLAAVAAAGGGRLRRISADDSDIDALLSAMSGRPGSAESAGQEAAIWREEGPWLLLLVLLLATLAFRRGVLAAWLLVLILPVQQARALTADNLWARPDQRASHLLAAGDAAAAAELFNNPAWKAAAAYKAGQYAESLAALEGLNDIESTYNRGNALARLNRLDEAIDAYEDVLQRDPDHQDARYNLDALKKLQQQQKQQQQNGDNSAAGSDGQDSGGGDSANQAAGDESSASRQTGNDGQDSGNGDSGSQDSGSEQPPSRQAGNDGRDSAGGGVDKQNLGDEQSASRQAGDAGSDVQAAGQRRGGQANGSQADDRQRSGEDTRTQAAEQGSVNEAAPESDQSSANAAEPQSGETDGRPVPQRAATGRDASQAPDENAQAVEQWLRKIPDDPGGLLRRKFYYQYKRQAGEPQEEQPW